MGIAGQGRGQTSWFSAPSRGLKATVVAGLGQRESRREKWRPKARNTKQNHKITHTHTTPKRRLCCSWCVFCGGAWGLGKAGIAEGGAPVAAGTGALGAPRASGRSPGPGRKKSERELYKRGIRVRGFL